VALPNINIDKFKEVYDEVMGDADARVTIAIVGRNGVGKAAVGAWLLLDQGSINAGEVADISMCEYDGTRDATVRAIASAGQADVIIFVVDASTADYKKDMAVWQAVRDMKKPCLLVGNKLDKTGMDAPAARRRLADVFGAPVSQIAIVSATIGVNVLEELLPRLVAVAREVEIPLARRFPVFRKAVANRIVTATAAENAVVGTLFFLPAADLPVMTANQVKMILKIAVAYGQEVGLERLKELMVVFGSAIVFRAAARNLASFVPVLGWAVKGGIAYGGTVALGKTAIKYFENDATVSLPGIRAIEAKV
jgi:uncharacterized protein (DUF697 family)